MKGGWAMIIKCTILKKTSHECTKHELFRLVSFGSMVRSNPHHFELHVASVLCCHSATIRPLMCFQVPLLLWIDFFGELGALVAESPGLPLRRTRSAYALTANCILMTLTYDDVRALRQESHSIDIAVAEVCTQIRKYRSSSIDSRERVLDERDLVNTNHAIETLANKTAKQQDKMLEMMATLMKQQQVLMASMGVNK